MELAELLSLVQETLYKQGLKLSPLIASTSKASYFIVDDELYRKRISDAAAYEAFYGNCLEIRVCPHRNGSKADTSYYLAIQDVDCSSFKDYRKIKLMRSQTQQTLVRKITNFTLDYKSYLQERKFYNIVEKLLG